MCACFMASLSSQPMVLINIPCSAGCPRTPIRFRRRAIFFALSSECRGIYRSYHFVSQRTATNACLGRFVCNHSLFSGLFVVGVPLCEEETTQLPFFHAPPLFFSSSTCVLPAPSFQQ